MICGRTIPCLQAVVASGRELGVTMSELISADQEELLFVRNAATKKRLTLLAKARRMDSRRRYLQVASGAMALLSGLITGTVFTDYFETPTWIKVGTTLLTFTSGVVTLMLNTYANHKEADEMFKGAAKFLSIRDRAHMESERVYDSAQQKEKALSKVKAVYQSVSRKYDRYLPATFDSQYRDIGLGGSKPLT